MHVIVVGANGIGQVYIEQLQQRNIEYSTIDPVGGDYSSFDTFYRNKGIDIKKNELAAIIAAPNFLHEQLVEEIAPHAQLILLEKPMLGSLSDLVALRTYVLVNHRCTLIGVKNNFFRNDAIHEVGRAYANMSKEGTVEQVNIIWSNYNRVPMPGTWRTDKSKAFGGVSWDLFPHLFNFLQILESHRNNHIASRIYMNLTDVNDMPDHLEFEQMLFNRIKSNRIFVKNVEKKQNWNIDSFGAKGVYDVDDYALLQLQSFNESMSERSFDINILANWKNDDDKVGDMLRVEVIGSDRAYFDFGLCPNDAYGRMIDHYIGNIHLYPQTSLDYFTPHYIMDAEGKIIRPFDVGLDIMDDNFTIGILNKYFR